MKYSQMNINSCKLNRASSFTAKISAKFARVYARNGDAVFCISLYGGQFHKNEGSNLNLCHL